MIRLGFLICTTLVLLAVARWPSITRLRSATPAAEALQEHAAAGLLELREVASSWLVLPQDAGAGAVSVKAPEPVERVVPPGDFSVADEEHELPRLADAGKPAGGPVESDAVAPALGQFTGRDLDESARIVERLLAVYGRLGGK